MRFYFVIFCSLPSFDDPFESCRRAALCIQTFMDNSTSIHVLHDPIHEDPCRFPHQLKTIGGPSARVTQRASSLLSPGTTYAPVAPPGRRASPGSGGLPLFALAGAARAGRARGEDGFGRALRHWRRGALWKSHAGGWAS